MLTKFVLTTFALTSLAAAATHEVQVGAGGKGFSPNQITAAVNDEVVFVFTNSDHDVAQSSYGSPCTPLEGGLYSGRGESGKRFSVTIENTDPIWLYCSIGNHCRKGMTAVINPPSSGNNLEDYTEAAAGAGDGVTPTQTNDGAAAEPSGTATGTNTAGGAATSSAAANTLLTKESMVINGAIGALAIAGSWVGLL